MLEKHDFIICVDMDDTIENLCYAWVHWLNMKHNLNVRIEDITSWKISYFFPTLTEEQIFEPLNTPEFWYTIEPKPDAIKYLRKLYDDGFSIYICTSTHYSICTPKMNAVIDRYFNFIDWKHIITCSCKQMIKCNILIDDGVHNLIDGDYIPILFDTPHNRTFNNEEYSIDRVTNWKEIYKLVNYYYNEVNRDVK